MEATPVYLPLRFNQILDIVKQLPKPEKQKLIAFLLKQSPGEEALTLTHFASEQALAKDWLTQTEDVVWKDL